MGDVITMDVDASEVIGALKLLKFEQDTVLDGN